MVFIKFENLLLNQYQRKFFKGLLQKKEIPHLILYGPAGTGKTTMAHTLARTILADFDFSFYELNASNDRGIDVIKEKVTNFAQNKSLANEIKILLMDESESLTPEAQFCLRRIMETYINNFRIIFTTNNLKKIDEAIQSRCITIPFDKIEVSQVKNFLILKNFNNFSIMKMLENFNGDFRSILKKIKYPNYKESSTIINFEKFFEKKDMNSDYDYVKLIKLNYNTSYKKFFDDFLNYLLIANISNTEKSEIISQLALLEFNLLNNGDFILNTLHLKSQILKISSKYNKNN